MLTNASNHVRAEATSPILLTWGNHQKKKYEDQKI